MINRYLQRHSTTIPRRSNERRQGKFDDNFVAKEIRSERCFNRLKQFRRVATRYEKKKQMLTLQY